VITAPGIALGDRYRLERRIAVGGMGEVWQGYDESLLRPVAVKVLRDEYAGDSGFLARFRTEARNSAALHHPNIATLLDYGEQDGSAYLVMELVVGEPLSDVLERTPVVPSAQLVPVLAQSARGLAAAHEAGVVHRDVKPGNILIARGGRVKITDFGVSRSAGQPTMTASGMVMGTAQYLSPEQAVGRPATPLSDLYSLGVVAYEALVGHRPFTGPTVVDIAVAHVNDPVPPLPSTVEPDLAALVMRLLAKDAGRRPQSADELAELFDALTPRTPPQGVAIVVTAPGPVPDAAPAPAPTADGDPVTRPAPPPSFPPARPVRPPLPRHGSGRHGAPRPVPPRPTPQAVGHRLGRWTWPAAVVALLLLGVLGALLADRLTGAAAGRTAPSTVREQGFDVGFGPDGRVPIVTGVAQTPVG